MEPRLDQTLGPNLSELNTGLGGCATCTPIVTVNSSTGAVTKAVEFYTLGHYSKYALPGSQRIYSSNNPAVVTVAFLNPDHSKALVAYNNSSATQTFTIQWGTLSFPYTLPAFAAATFTWTGTQTGAPSTPATSQIQGSSFSSASGLETETTADATGAYDLGYVSPNGYRPLQECELWYASVSGRQRPHRQRRPGRHPPVPSRQPHRPPHRHRHPPCHRRLADLADRYRHRQRSIRPPRPLPHLPGFQFGNLQCQLVSVQLEDEHRDPIQRQSKTAPAPIGRPSHRLLATHGDRRARPGSVSRLVFHRGHPFG